MASFSGMRIPKEIWHALDNAAFLTVPQTARLLGCDERTVRKSIGRREIPATKVGAQWRVPTWWLRAQIRPPEVAA
jgi:excisionase family DNA binding protein